MQPIIFALVTIVSATLSAGRGVSPVDECTDGFMSLDRIDAVLDKYMYGSFDYTINGFQAIFPGVNFTCSGSIQSWIFAAAIDGTATSSLPELQIWRSNGNESYIKVGSTTVNVIKENATQLYHFPLSSPLAFQAGDILGYYQPEITQSQVRLYAEKGGRGRQLAYYISSASAYSGLSLPTESGDDRFQSFIDVQTDSPGCECGFMSVERMRILLELDTVNQKISYPQRQQITPQMRFTCDGWITKWIIGARMAGGSVYPEIQVWRNTSNTYQKINGVPIVVTDMSGIQRYEISNFDPIAIQAGDILGVFLPPPTSSRLTLLSEDTTSPTNYYLTTDSTDSESPYDIMDLENTASLMMEGYHLLVTVEIATTNPRPPLIPTSVTSPITISSLPFPCNETSSPELCSEDERGGSLHQNLAVPLIIVTVGVVAALIFVVLVTIILILAYLLREAKHKKTVYLQRPNDHYSVELQPNSRNSYYLETSPIYSGVGHKEMYSTNPYYLEENPIYSEGLQLHKKGTNKHYLEQSPIYSASKKPAGVHNFTKNTPPLHPEGTPEGEYEVLRHGKGTACASDGGKVNTAQHHLAGTQEGQYEVLQHEVMVEKRESNGYAKTSHDITQEGQYEVVCHEPQTETESRENNGYTEVSQNRMTKLTLLHMVEVNDNPLYVEAAQCLSDSGMSTKEQHSTQKGQYEVKEHEFMTERRDSNGYAKTSHPVMKPKLPHKIEINENPLYVEGSCH